MRRQVPLFLLAVIAIPAALPAFPVEITTSAAAHQAAYADLEVTLRLVGGTGAVLMPGRSVNLTFQTNADACVIIYNIDAEGNVNLLYPAGGRLVTIPGNTVQFLPEQGTGVVWETGDRTGVEYIHAVAVDGPDRIDAEELAFLARSASLPAEKRLKIDSDPFLAFNMIDEELVLEADRTPPATDYTYFYVNRKVDYPGYLCYQCHSPSKIPDPYAMKCTEVVIEKIEGNEGAGYPYPNLYAIAHMDEWYENSEKYTYEAGDLGLDSGGDYDDSRVYLSVYYSGGYNPYYYNWYPWYWYGHPSWYWGVSWNSYWGWGWDVGFGWGWGGYYHHYPYCSWYPYGCYPYYGYGGCYPYDYCYGYPAYYPSRSLYAGRSFTKRDLDYHKTAVKQSRDQTLASSRLTRERDRSNSSRGLERSELARRVSHGQTRTSTSALDGMRRQTARSRDFSRTGIEGIAARRYNERGARDRGTDRREAIERRPSSDRSSRSLDRGARDGGSGIERRLERNARERDAVRAKGSSRSGSEGGIRRSSDRYAPQDRRSRGSEPATRSRQSEPSKPSPPPQPGKDGGRSSGSKSSGRESGARSSGQQSSPAGGSSRGSSGGSSRGSSGGSSRGSSGGSSRGSSGGKSGRR